MCVITRLHASKEKRENIVPFGKADEATEHNHVEASEHIVAAAIQLHDIKLPGSDISALDGPSGDYASPVDTCPGQRCFCSWFSR